MSWLVAIDPGTTNLGAAIFEEGVLVGAKYFKHPTPTQLTQWAATYTPDAVWVRERMQKYDDVGHAHKNLDAIEALMKNLAFEAAYRPRVWKGSVPKHIHHRRVRQLLIPSEVRLWDTLGPDEKDAVAIGLFHLGRLGRGGRPGKAGKTK